MAATLQLNAMLGLRLAAPGSLIYLDETDVQFISGRNLIRYDCETRAVKIQHGSLEASGITAVAVTPNRRHTAYAELMLDGTPQVAIFDWNTKKKKKFIAGIDARAPVTQLHFASDGKHLIVQTGGPDWILYYVQWDKGAGGRIVAAIRNATSPGKPIVQVDTHPTDPHSIVITGQGVAKLYRLQEETFKPLPVNLRRDPCPLAGHCWAPDDRLIIATTSGDLLVLEGGDVKKVLDPPAQGGVKGIASIVATSKGFLVGCDGGLLRVYEKADDARLFYRCTKQYTIGAGSTGDAGGEVTVSGRGGAITSLAVSPTEEDLAVGVATGQAYSFKLASHDLAKAGDVMFHPLVATTHSAAFSQHDATDAHHTGGTSGQSSSGADPRHAAAQAITGLDVCQRKPWFATCGSDRTVRIWNYTGQSASDRDRDGGGGGMLGGGGGSDGGGGGGPQYDVAPALEVAQRFAEAPTCVALHPTGFHVAVGFEGSLQLCSVMLDGIRLVKELPLRSCSDVKFSHGGGMVACAAGSAIAVYNTYTCGLVASLRGHADRVACIAWSRDDRHVVSVGKDGMVARWAVVVPNAASVTTGAGAGAQGGGAAAGKPGEGGAAGAAAASRPSSAAVAQGPLLQVGKMTHSQDVRDLHPFSIACGTSDGGKDVYVSGCVVKGLGANAVLTPVLRHIDLTAAKAEATRGDVQLAGGVVHSLALAGITVSHAAAGQTGGVGAPFALLAGMGHKLARTGGGSGDDRDHGTLRRGESNVGGAGGSVASMTSPMRGESSHGVSRLGSSPALNRQGSMGGSQLLLSSPNLKRQASHLGGFGSSSSAAPGSVMDMDGAASVAGSTIAASMASGPEPDPVGCLRAYRIPLPGGHAAAAATSSGGDSPDKQQHGGSKIGSGGPDHVDVVCHSGAVTHMAFTRDGRLLITAAADGSIGMWSVNDPHAGKAGASGGASSSSSATAASSASSSSGAVPGSSSEPLPWCEEVAVTRKDLDSVVKERVALEQRVAEITLMNKYAERDKEMSNEAKLLDIEAQFTDEIEAAREHLASLRESREAMEARFVGQAGDLEAHQAKELEDLESLYKGKIAGEMGRYDRLIKERDRMNAEFEAGMAALAEEQAAEMAALRRASEAAIADEERAVAGLEGDRRKLGEDSAAQADSIERDVDGEIEDMRARFETRLAVESKSTLLLKGENGFMKRKFVTINKEISDQKEEIASLAETEKELQEAISALQKDVAGHKKEMKERDETIGDKESRIYELKKKNQELEKFKFVLNYKIQELKRQIMPKKKEIADMRDQLKEMEMELFQYHKSNAALDLMIGELRLKRDGMSAEVVKLQSAVAEKDETLLGIGRDVTAVQSQAVDAKALRSAMVHLYHKYIHSDAASLSLAMASTTTGVDMGEPGADGKPMSMSQRITKGGAAALPPGVNLEDLQSELSRQRQHLERGVDSMKRRIEKEAQAFATDRSRLLRENSVLTQEINDLRRDLKYLQAQLAVESGNATVGGTVTSVPLGMTAAAKGKSATTSALASTKGTLSGGRRTGALLGIVGSAGVSGTGTLNLAVSPIRAHGGR